MGEGLARLSGFVSRPPCSWPTSHETRQWQTRCNAKSRRFLSETAENLPIKDTRVKKLSSAFEIGINIYTNKTVHQDHRMYVPQAYAQKGFSKSNVCSSQYWRCRERRLRDGNKKKTTLSLEDEQQAECRKCPYTCDECTHRLFGRIRKTHNICATTRTSPSSFSCYYSFGRSLGGVAGPLRSSTNSPSLSPALPKSSTSSTSSSSSSSSSSSVMPMMPSPLRRPCIL
jgi:hypothetical protein